MSKEYCTARQNDKTCFVPNCRYHIFLIGNIKELLQKLDAFCFSYQHVYCLCTHFKYHFSGKIVVKSGQLFDNLQRALNFNHQNRGVDRVPSIAKKETLEEKVQAIFVELLPKDKIDANSGSVFAGRIVKVEKTKFELERTKFVDSVLHGHGNYTSILVSFKIKSL